MSPADGAVSQSGRIDRDQLMQAKGHTYTLSSLAGRLGRGFENGSFCTVYLAPSDYHRVHLPFSGTLTETLAVPGELFSVNSSTEQAIEGLFARNERLVCRFETEFGPMLVILVGAMIVASIETDWLGPTALYTEEEHTEHHLVYRRGDEIVFERQDAVIELMIFDQVHMRQAPPSPIDGKPQRRATLSDVECLLTEAVTLIIQSPAG